MQILLIPLILAIQPTAPIDERYPGAEPVFSCDFEQEWDANFDDWPDDWTRRSGRGYPRYVEIRLERGHEGDGGRCLRIDLDGGAAVAYSPAIEVSPRYTYVVQGLASTSGLEHNAAYLTVTFFDADGNRQETLKSRALSGTSEWQRLEIPAFSTSRESAATAIVGLHLEPGGSGYDLRGTARFDQIQFVRLARMKAWTNRPYNLFTSGEPVEVHCELSGFENAEELVEFELEDAFGRTLARAQRRAEAVAEDALGAVTSEEASAKPAQVARARWKPPIEEVGFYRVLIRCDGEAAPRSRRELTLAVIEPQSAPAAGEFGWSFPDGEGPMQLEEVQRLAVQMGINWLKFPLWIAGSDVERVERLIAVNDYLRARRIVLVGMLARPPENWQRRMGLSGSPTAAEIFSQTPESWSPSLEVLLTPLGLKVRHWQIGTDTDTSFVGFAGLEDKVEQLKQAFAAVTPGAAVGLGWNWMYELPALDEGRRTFLNVSAEPPLTPEELGTYLASGRGTGPRRWTVLEPLERGRYSTRTRTFDLVQRMLAAKMHGADAVFIPDVFDDRRGMLHRDGTPTELLLPWRTTALALAGTRYVGSIRLPNGSRNHIFSRDGEAVMVAWSAEPTMDQFDEKTEEQIALGANVLQFDLWGRAKAPESGPRGQHIEVGSLPVFVEGLDKHLVDLRRSCEFARSRLPSIFGEAHENTLRFTNPFEETVRGTVKLVTPEEWAVEPDEFGFAAEPGERIERTFYVTFPFHASSGPHEVRVDFDVAAEKSYRFSVHRTLDVGLGDVELKAVTRLSPTGKLEVEQTLVNHSDEKVSFRCDLLTRTHRRQRSQVYRLGQGRDVKFYYYPDGDQLIGRTFWLRAEEIGGPRVLNYRFQAGP